MTVIKKSKPKPLYTKRHITPIIQVVKKLKLYGIDVKTVVSLSELVDELDKLFTRENRRYKKDYVFNEVFKDVIPY